MTSSSPPATFSPRTRKAPDRRRRDRVERDPPRGHVHVQAEQRGEQRRAHGGGPRLRPARRRVGRRRRRRRRTAPAAGSRTARRAASSAARRAPRPPPVCPRGQAQQRDRGVVRPDGAGMVRARVVPGGRRGEGPQPERRPQPVQPSRRPRRSRPRTAGRCRAGGPCWTPRRRPAPVAGHRDRRIAAGHQNAARNRSARSAAQSRHRRPPARPNASSRSAPRRAAW